MTDAWYPIVYLDGFHLKVRLARQVVSVPVLAVLGVAAEVARRGLPGARSRRAEAGLAPDREGAGGRQARAAYADFVRKWSRLVPAVVRSLEEAGLALLTFYEFPRPIRKTLRTTNPLENLNREFRRRTKTQGSFGTEAAAVTLLWGLIAFGQIRMRRVDGYQHLPVIIDQQEERAA